MQIWESWSGWNQSGLQTDERNIANLNIVHLTMVYEMLQHVLVLQNQLEEALEISERGRARAMLNLLSQRLLTSTQFAISPPTVADLRNIAKTQGATLVEYSIIEYSTNPGNAVLLIWVIQPNGTIAFHAVNLSTLPQSLTELVTTSRNTLGVRNRSKPATIVPEPTPNARQRQQAQQRQKLQQLYQLLIEPIAQYLPTNSDERVIFIPQGELFLVPFPALVDAQGKYLIEKHTILTAPSIQVLDLTRQQRQLVGANQPSLIQGDDVLVVGNPIMPKVWNPAKSIQEPLSSLPGAEEEAVTIAKVFATKPLLWEQASESTVVQRMPEARIIHLATHGLLEYGSPEDSGVRDFPGAIALAPSSTDDGLLTSTEILNMDLQAELVVLSACDTGRGRITGDGTIGLSRSLITAGVPSVIVSLWSVPDAPTADLMSEFYHQWQQNPDKAKALRQAMLITMQNHPNPRDWAAFTLIGESE
jgi:CHAT domain-containing protein